MLQLHLKRCVYLFILLAFSAWPCKLIEINYFICYGISDMASSDAIVFLCNFSFRSAPACN